MAKLTVAAGAALGTSVLFAPAAEAAVFPVTTTSDAGDGTCDATCTLRDAVDDANATATEDQVVFQSGLSGTIELASGAIPITEPVAIQGPGAGALAVSGLDADRIFAVLPATPGDPVSISGLTLRNGNSAVDGGAIHSFDAALTIADSVLADNNASGGGGALYSDGTSSSVRIVGSTFTGSDAGSNGGAISVDETAELADAVVISGSTVTGNTSLGNGGGIYLDDIGGPGDAGGGILVEGSTIADNYTDDNGGGLGLNNLDAPGLTIASTTISGNEGGGDNRRGAGLSINNADGPVAIRDSVFADNSGAEDGGGIAINNLGDFGELGGPRHFVLERSTIAGNSALYGGGLYLNNVFAGAEIENSTFSDNSASYEGGGIYVQSIDSGGLTVANSTVVQNSAGDRGGGVFRDEEAPAISSSIVSGNAAPEGPDLGQDSGNAVGMFQIGFSLIGSTAGATYAESTGGSNLIGVDPQLGPLASNGGPTQTHLPAVTSPAVDAGIANGLATDQRGASRTFDALNIANRPGSDATDIGSVELLPGGRLALAQCKGQTENVLFAPGQPILGTDGADVIVGTASADQINAARGKDLVCAGAGNDTAKGGAGKDRVFGEAGRDKLKGNAGKDKARGGGGKDRLKGGAGGDRLSGQAGRDTLKGNAGADRLKGGPGKDKLRGGPGRDRLNGGPGRDSERQ